MKGTTILFFQIPECVAGNTLEGMLTSILADINVNVDSNALEAYHRFGKPERTLNQEKPVASWCSAYHYCKTSFN